ncbi:MAG: hypothetical protein AB7G68_17530 [Nitrospiraceae bacterium]
MRHVVLSFVLLTFGGCVTTLPASPDSSEVTLSSALVVGHVVTVLIGPTTRPYAPELRFFELINTATQERIRVDIESKDRWFIVPLLPGDYELSRLQISEGAFQSTAGLNPGFKVIERRITYVGTWRLGIESPQYDRSALLSAIEEDREIVRRALVSYDSLREYPFSTYLLAPTPIETRLYEVPPYPRFWWFRRHHTS